MKILFIGDIVGSIGRNIITTMIEKITSEEDISFIIANGENATHGKGLSEAHLNELFDAGIDVVTLGNHYANKKEIFNFLDSYNELLRPNNLHHSIPGTGTNVFEIDGVKIRVTNLLGRVYMAIDVNNPFDDLESIFASDDSDIHIVDFHAEATGEKYALAHAFDGKVSAVLGTHTHVQTRDNRILPYGTAYISDVGMCGPYDSILGVKKEDVVKRTWTSQPTPFNVQEEGESIFSAVLLTFNDQTYECERIQTIYEILD